MWKTLRDGIDLRIGLKDLIETKLKGYRIPKDTNIFYTLGIVALFAYMIMAVTGYFLLIYYIPHTEQAFKSVQLIMTKVPYGWLVRMIHIVASSLMLIVVSLHMISIFIMGSYKRPREVTWFLGGLLMLITLTFCLSGYLLPWSQRSYWATTVTTSIPTAFPVIGDYITRLLRGGEHVTGVTLSRFFALHVAFLPPIFLGIVGLHIFFIWRIGLSTPGFSKSAQHEQPWTGYRRTTYPESYPFYPNFVLKEALMITIFFALTFFIISFMPNFFMPEAANTPANPFKTPVHVKPEWYFLAPYQLLRLIPNKLFGITIQILLIILFLLWPFIDRSEERNILKRPLLLVLFLVLLGLWVVLTIWGRYS